MHRFAAALLLLALLSSAIPALADVDVFASANGITDDTMEIAVDQPLDPETAARNLKRLQLDLIQGGYLQGKADGILGPATRDAICAAQAALGQPVTGVANAALTEALRAATLPLEPGSRSGLVYEVQETLYRWGYLEEKPSGYFGETTRRAVVSFQTFAAAEFAEYLQRRMDARCAAMDVPEDVVVDVPLCSADRVCCDGVMTEDWCDFLREGHGFPRVSAEDGEGESVKRVQRRLHALGYLRSGFDGSFGEATALALKYFQRRNGLPETGACDEFTGAALFSEDAVESDEFVMPYAVYVKRSKSRVYVMGWDGAGYNTKVKSFKCSCGARSTPTPKGTFYMEGPLQDWYYMPTSKVWVRYAVKIKGNYFFHSVLFRHKGDRHPTSGSQSSLGSNVSHGCIRLAVEDIKWLYKHSAEGMKVVIV